MTLFTRFLTAAIVLASLSSGLTAQDLMVYSSKNASYLEPLFNEYSRETGVLVSYKIAPAEALLFLLNSENIPDKPDVLIASGAHYFQTASERGLLAEVTSKTLQRNVPSHLKSSKNDWFAFAKRARVIVYNPNSVDRKELGNYADLAKEKWNNQLCLLDTREEYSLNHIAWLNHYQGEKETTRMLQGWHENLATTPFNDDLLVIEAIEQGHCDVGIVHSYYFARHKHNLPDSELALFWPNQENTGVHLDISGAAVTAVSENQKQAIDLLEWLSTKQTQVLYANLSMEFPVHRKVNPPREIGKWGKFKEDETHPDHWFALRESTSKLTEQVMNR